MESPISFWRETLSVWRETLGEVVKSTAPIVALLIALRVTLIEFDAVELAVIVLGSLMALAGLVLFLFGARVGIVPFGERLGSRVPGYGSVALLIAFGVVIGLAITIAEPNVRVMETQVDLAAPGFLPPGSLVWAIVLGVALFTGLGMVRTAYQIPLVKMLIPSYILTFFLLYFAPPAFVGIAFDSGGAATGPLSVPFILAFNVGVVSVLGRRNGVEDSFGVVALASIGPVAAVLLLGVLLGGLR